MKQYDNQTIHPKIYSDLLKIKVILSNKYTNILYEDNRRFVIFKFLNFKYVKENILYIQRIIDKTINNIYLSRDEYYNIIILIPKFNFYEG